MNPLAFLIKASRIMSATILYVLIDVTAAVIPFVLMVIPFVVAYFSKHVLPSKDIQLILFVLAFVALFMIGERGVGWSRSLQVFFRTKTQKLIETIGGKDFLMK